MAAPAAAARVAKATAATVSGTIKSVDASAKTLTLTTAKGDETFSLGDKTSIHHGSKAATVADLSSLSGQPAKVHYTDSNGTKMVTSVMVGGAHHRRAQGGVFVGKTEVGAAPGRGRRAGGVSAPLEPLEQRIQNYEQRARR